mmetsp:Transcript_30594/g.41439  ORF Transcript_30594/g.41439 Transcript_30594/m.41439 type:complete len:232 (-) Transcript_30594:241-936(-)
MAMWIRRSAAFPGIVIELCSFDLHRFYPSIDLAATESGALGQACWVSLEDLLEMLKHVGPPFKADATIAMKAIVDLLAMNGSGVMGASSMSNAAQVVSLAIELVYKKKYHRLIVFSGNSTYECKVYVDDVGMAEPSIGSRLEEARQEMALILHQSMGPDAVKGKFKDWSCTLTYTGKKYMETSTRLDGKLVKIPLSKHMKAFRFVSAPEFGVLHQGGVPLKSVSGLAGLLT